MQIKKETLKNYLENLFTESENDSKIIMNGFCVPYWKSNNPDDFDTDDKSESFYTVTVDWTKKTLNKTYKEIIDLIDKAHSNYFDEFDDIKSYIKKIVSNHKNAYLPAFYLYRISVLVKINAPAIIIENEEKFFIRLYVIYKHCKKMVEIKNKEYLALSKIICKNL